MAEKKATGIRAKIIEFWRRLTPVGKDNYKNLIYLNGENNLYPYEVEAAINSSPTASKSSDMMKKFIAGKGVKLGYKDPIVNEDGEKLSNIIESIAEDVSRQYGSFIHVTYGIDLQPKEIRLLEYVECRKLKKDDNGDEGRIVVNDWIGDNKKDIGSKKKALEQWYYPFNKRKNVIEAQIRRDAGKSKDEELDLEEDLKSYRGQVFYLNLTSRYEYALSKLNSVYDDANSEYQFSIYVNTQLRTGFVGKAMVLTKGLEGEQKEEIVKIIDKWLGSENSASMVHVSLDNVDKLDDVVAIKQFDANFDDKLFESTSARIKKNIMGAFNNIPPALVDSGEGALFGTSGDAYAQMKLFYSEQTEWERNKISEALTTIGFPCEIQPLIEAATTIAPTDTGAQTTKTNEAT